jgi:hypothetical protein
MKTDRERYYAKVDYSQRCSATDKYQDRCTMCQNHPGEHRFPVDEVTHLCQQFAALTIAVSRAGFTIAPTVDGGFVLVERKHAVPAGALD